MKRSKDYKPFDYEEVPTAVPSYTSFTHDQLLRTLYWIFDFMDRASINFYLIGDTAKQVMGHQYLSGNKINVAVRKNEWESGSRSTADSFAPPLKDNGDTVEYKYEGIPVTVYVLDDSPMFTSADIVMYYAEGFKIPNPYSQFEREYSWLIS